MPGKKKSRLWEVPGRKATYESWQSVSIKRIKQDVKRRLRDNPRRLAHSISVARTAERMATLYDVDPYLATVAGLLHDWDKIVPNEELIRRANHFGIDLGVPLERVEPLLHGMVAARELPERYPQLPQDVWHAISCHTSASEDMGPLDMIIFVADGVEPLRRSSEGIEQTRGLVGKASLEDVFWNAFVGGIVYVLETGRYLYPGTVDTYNTIAGERIARANSR